MENLELQELEDTKIYSEAGPLPIAAILGAAKTAASKAAGGGGLKVGLQKIVPKIFKKKDTPNESPAPVSTPPVAPEQSSPLKNTKMLLIIGGVILSVFLIWKLMSGKKRRKY